MPSKSAWIQNLRFSSKITGFVIVSLLLLALATVVVMQFVLTSEAARDAQERQETNMRVAWDVLHQYGTGFSERDGKLYIGDRSLDGFYEPVDRVKTLVGGTATVFHLDTRITTNVKKPDGSRAVGTKLTDEAVRDAVLVRGVPFRGQADILDVPYFTAYDPIKDRNGKVIGVLYTGIPRAEFLAGVNDAMLTIALVSLIVTALVGFVAYMFLNRTFSPLSQLCALLDRLRQGETAFSIEGVQRQDEIGTIARAISAFREATIARERDQATQREVVAEIGKSLGELAEGNLTVEITAAFPEAYEPIRRDFNRATGALAAAMATVVTSSRAINTGAGEISQASDDLAQRTERQATSLAETAAAMDQITTGVRNSARNAVLARDTITQTRADAQHSAEVVNKVIEAMRAIETASGEISQIISVIDGIAFQTNLLALNAGVEAARAGEAGKGFAVVASEVRSLAQRSAEAAGDVKTRISGSAQQVEGGVKLVSQASDALGRVFGSIDDISTAVRTLADSAEQQSDSLEQVNKAVSDMNMVTQQNAAMVEEATAAARSLANESDMLSREMGRFHIGQAMRPDPAPTVATGASVQRLEPARTALRRPRAAVAAVSSASAQLAVQENADWSEF
ncbi:methyl-accepting chemotaxis protein [Novosphingobium sp.]|uniref:methyl-accepting chemotaxis protein n=1 Tax=Novosphingobium sp. TaxID=1874826 RepID=UPI00262FE710|nr:methyl-accepting chemotaxis protein [Novosphingobium sp.]